MTRPQFAALTKLGEATIARWEAGNLIQNAANDKFLRLLVYPENVERLRDRAQRPSNRIDLKPFRPKFREIQDVPSDLASRAAGFATTLVM